MTCGVRDPELVELVHEHPRQVELFQRARIGRRVAVGLRVDAGVADEAFERVGAEFLRERCVVSGHARTLSRGRARARSQLRAETDALLATRAGQPRVAGRACCRASCVEMRSTLCFGRSNGATCLDPSARPGLRFACRSTAPGVRPESIVALWTSCHRVGTKRRAFSGSIGVMRSQRPPTARQIYALAAALCEKAGEPFPETLAEASTQLERLRTELGHPAPRLADCPPPRQRTARRGPGRGVEKLASAIAAELAKELR